MMLSRVEPGMSPTARPHRGLFAAGDAWLRTGDLFYRDEDGDFWLAGSADSLVTTAHGVVGGSAVEDALGILDAIDMSVTYAAPGADGDDIAATAVTLRSGRSLDAEDLSAALGSCHPTGDRMSCTSSSASPPARRIDRCQRVRRSRATRAGPGVYQLDRLSGEYRAVTNSKAAANLKPARSRR